VDSTGNSFAIETYKGQTLAYLTANASALSIDRPAFAKAHFDLNRSYESAGYLLGNVKDGVMSVKEYVPAEGIKRSENRLLLDEAATIAQFKAFKEAGYDTIIGMRAHPYHQSSKFRQGFLLSNPDVFGGLGGMIEEGKNVSARATRLGRNAGLSNYLEGEFNLYGVLENEKDVFVVFNVFGKDGKRLPIKVHGDGAHMSLMDRAKKKLQDAKIST
jgi:hypothetical protein